MVTIDPGSPHREPDPDLAAVVRLMPKRPQLVKLRLDFQGDATALPSTSDKAALAGVVRVDADARPPRSDLDLAQPNQHTTGDEGPLLEGR